MEAGEKEIVRSEFEIRWKSTDFCSFRTLSRVLSSDMCGHSSSLISMVTIVLTNVSRTTLKEQSRKELE